MFKLMHKLTLAVGAAPALFVIPISAFSQSIQIQIGPGGVRIDDGRGRGGQCEELRRAWSSAKEIAADTGRPAKDQFGGMCAAN
jgi:hypothetical protein